MKEALAVFVLTAGVVAALAAGMVWLERGLGMSPGVASCASFALLAVIVMAATWLVTR